MKKLYAVPFTFTIRADRMVMASSPEEAKELAGDSVGLDEANLIESNALWDEAIPTMNIRGVDTNDVNGRPTDQPTWGTPVESNESPSELGLTPDEEEDDETL